MWLTMMAPVVLLSQANIHHWEAVVQDGTSWHYLVPSEQPAPDWFLPGFDASAWPVGPSGLGYADDDDVTLVPNTMSLYLTREFEFTDFTSIDSVLFYMDYDDGFVAYLNGVEIARGNAGEPGEFIAWDQNLDIDQEAVLYQGGIPEAHPIDYQSLFVDGTNILAIEVHNANPWSSDLTARPFLFVGATSAAEVYNDTPNWFYGPTNPCPGQMYSVVLTTGAWAGEVGWSIINFDGEVVATSVGGYVDWTTYEQLVCLPPDCYEFWMLDSWGDGWNGASFELQDEEGDVLLSGELLGGGAQSLVFQTGGDCEILGCTNPYGINYEPFANVDDGSCVLFEETNLPIVKLTTPSNILDDPRITAHMGIIHNADGLNHVDDSLNNYNGHISIEIRGSSSQLFPKKSYALETQDSLGNNNNVSVIDLPVENDWILHAPYTDKTMMRNALTFQLGRDIGRYTPRTKYCELMINGDYRGVYMLMENIKRDNDRVDIATLLPTDTVGDELTGGYILKVDKFTGDFEGGWTSPYPNMGGEELVIQFHKPESDELHLTQTTYIQDHVTAFEDVLAGDDFADPVNGFRAYADVQSFIDLYLMNELSKNIDGYRLSTYFYKDKDSNGGKIVMGPWWDYNLSFGNADYCECWDPTGFEVNTDCGWNNPFWWERMLEDPAYADLTRCTWEQYRAGPWSNDNVHGLIDSLETALVDAHHRDFARWPRLGQYVWPNWFIGDTYAQELDFMRVWIDDRLEWLDNNISGACFPGCTDPIACNYDPEANFDDQSCTYWELYYDCDGNCNNDQDQDEVCDELDNCPEVYNPLQTDTNGDGYGDACQPVSVAELDGLPASREVLFVTNVLGQRLEMDAVGVVLVYYTDGRVERQVWLGRP